MKKILLISLILVAFWASEAYSADDNPEVIKVRIVNDNLFINIGFIGGFETDHVTLKLNGGKKIVLFINRNGNGQNHIYLDANDAYQLKAKGIKSIIAKGPLGSAKIKFSQKQVDEIIKTLP